MTRFTGALVACAVALAPALPVASALGATTVIHYKHESYEEFQRQLAAGQIHAVTFNKKPHSVRVT